MLINYARKFDIEMLKIVIFFKHFSVGSVECRVEFYKILHILLTKSMLVVQKNRYFPEKPAKTELF